jgi:4-amino-4-deoxy-L-arabinose transferase-like glycosyltransferase
MLAEPRTRGVGARIRRAAVVRGQVQRIGPDAWLVGAITAVAALLRFATITSQSLWVDEATTVHEVGLAFGQMLHELRLNETTPPLYFALAWVWTRVFGAGALGIRSLSAICGIALIPVIYLCGRELVSRATGIVACALAAVSPFMIWYSQEARSYMLFALLSAVSFLYAARAVRTNGHADVALWALSSALAILTHFFAAFLVAPEALWLLWKLRDRAVAAALAAVVAVAAVQLAVLPLAIGDTSHPLDWLLKFGLSERVNATPVDFAVSVLYLSGSSLASYGLPWTAGLAAVVALLLWRGGGPRERRGAAIAGVLALCVVLVPIVLAWLGHDYVYNRNFMPAWVPLAIVLGAACTVPRARVAGGLLAATLVALFVWANVEIAGDPSVQRPDWRGAAAALGRPVGPRVIIALDGNAAEQPLSIYLAGTRFSYLGLPAGAPAQRITELDVVGDPYTTPVTHLPSGVREIGTRVVSAGIQVWRFALDPAWVGPTQAFVVRAQTVIPSVATATPSVLSQR